MTPEEFIATIAPAAKASAAKTGIPASFVVAQAALESGWGESKLARFGFNLFGVKADKAWKGNTLTMNTREFLHGEWVAVPASWRKYADWLGCLDDHAAFLLGNPRYKIAFNGKRTGEDFARCIQSCGYATDPDYANKVIAVMRSHNLAELDTQPAG
jgi:flagellar rod assembly protein/muramidase FlgJ